MFGALIVAPKYSLISSVSARILITHAFVRMSDFRKYTDSSIYVAFPDKPVYFVKKTCVSPSRRNEVERSAGVSLSKFIAKDFDFLMLQPHVEAQECLQRYIETAIISQKIIRTLPDFNGGWSLCYSATDVNHYIDTTHGGSLKRGVFLHIDNADQNSSDVKEKILNIAKDHGLQKYYQFSHTRDNVYKRQEFNLNSEEKNCLKNCLQEDDFVCATTPPVYKLAGQSEKPNVSAIFSDVEYSPVFSNYKRSRSVLQKCSDYSEVMELLRISDQFIPYDFSVRELKSSMKFPFIVVEGMDATGKTTLTKTLENKMNAARYYTPPHQIEHLRKFFDTLPEIVRRAYYTIGNYIVAMEISKECAERAVIMDRYWHSTAAYGIANESSSGDHPPAGHSVYHWPSDLLKPSAILFLTVKEEIRRQRIKGRGIEKTFEEKSLDKDQLFRQRLCDSYLKMKNPGCVEIDASGSVDSVMQSAITVLKDHGIDLMENANSSIC